MLFFFILRPVYLLECERNYWGVCVGFVLNPHLSEEEKKKGFDRLKEENGVERDWFTEISWNKDYQIGSTGDPKINGL